MKYEMPVPFFSDEIKISVVEASDIEHIEKTVSLRQFANGGRLSLYDTECGYKAVRPDGTFIVGEEVT